jgi:predicted component of type VI protein secretion system
VHAPAKVCDLQLVVQAHLSMQLSTRAHTDHEHHQQQAHVARHLLMLVHMRALGQLQPRKPQQVTHPLRRLINAPAGSLA